MEPAKLSLDGDTKVGAGVDQLGQFSVDGLELFLGVDTVIGNFVELGFGKAVLDERFKALDIHWSAHSCC